MDTSVSAQEIASAMESLGMSSSEAEAYLGVVGGNLAVVAILDSIPLPDAEPVERAWHRPSADENPLGAWYVKTDIAGSATGRLAGRTLAVKDNLLLAGVPLMNGTHVLEGYVPDVDAEIIKRVLAAGARITGKTVCEAYCFSGGSHTSATGPVRNPHDPTRSAGGSSSGSGAVIAAGEADLAIGCDQGGSVRMPASFCGIVGMKPTFGLIPYTGILGMNPNIDHTGPMTANVADNALLLEVLAGRDGVDSRQSREVADDYEGVFTRELGGGKAGSDLEGLHIGVLREGFGGPGAEAVVDEKVRAAAVRLGKLGATVRDVSVPLHLASAGVTFGALQAMLTSMFHLDGCLIERPDVVPPSYSEHQSRWRERADDLPANVKGALISTEILRRRAGYTTVSRAMQRLPVLRAAYDTALEDADVLLMPTTPMRATPLPPADAPPEVVTALAFGPLANTGAFNSTHHPALSIPCGMSEGLPVGMMLVGQHFAEGVLYRVAHAFEQHEDWRQL